MHLSFQSNDFTLGTVGTSQYHPEIISPQKVIGAVTIKKEMYFGSAEHRTNEK